MVPYSLVDALLISALARLPWTVYAAGRQASRQSHHPGLGCSWLGANNKDTAVFYMQTQQAHESFHGRLNDQGDCLAWAVALRPDRHVNMSFSLALSNLKPRSAPLNPTRPVNPVTTVKATA